MTEAFLSRWSKRKQGQPLETSVEAAESQPPAQVQSEEAIQEPAEKELTDADMPDLESLDGQSDVSMFFSEGVSKALRQKALKQLFHQPSFNVISELDEYIEDYSQLTPLTSETAGKMRSLFKDKLDEWLEEEDQPIAVTSHPENKENDDDDQT